MKATEFKQLDEQDVEISDALISLGDEKGTGLRQPEISLAVKELKERNRIKEREDKKPGKGRPHKIYSLKIGLDEIVEQLEKSQKKKIDNSLAKIERLKELRE